MEYGAKNNIPRGFRVKKRSVKVDHNMVCETVCMFHSIAYLRYMLLNIVKGSIVNNKFRAVFF